MAQFPWEYHATNGAGMEPRGFDQCTVLIGLGEETPVGLKIEGTYVLRIDPNLKPLSSEAEGRLIGEWGDSLRLPVEGPHSQDHPYITATRRMQITWVGNRKLFPSTYDLMIAASYHADGNAYYLAERAGPDSPYMLWDHVQPPHPMSGRLPDPASFSGHDAERYRYVSIALGTIHAALAMTKCGHADGGMRIYRDLYSVYSAHTSVVVLLISYYGIHLSGDGSIQDKLNRSAEFRAMVAERMLDVVGCYMDATGTTTAADCAGALAARYGPIEPLG
jgi:hypothetical protein